ELFNRYRSGVDFIQKYVFPGGMLPSPSRLRAEVEGAGLRWVDSIEFGQDYSKTLRMWRRTFESRWDEIERLASERPFDPRFRRLWNFYLTVCAACFLAGTTDVAQVALRRA
ncbi:MAG: class I SAM-dependent methyltransferase, partial [Pseudomonadota bacterium]